MENFENAEIGKINNLKQQLENAGVDVSLWGTGDAKTLQHLLEEIESGESFLTLNKEGEIFRNVNVGTVEVYYISRQGIKYVLKEDKQVFRGESEKKRGFNHAVSEKIKYNEDPEGAIIRGIKEELGLEGEIATESIGIELEEKTSNSYPGLKSQYTLHRFKVILNDSQFKPDGYIEKTGDRTIYFIWEEIES